MKRYGFLPPGGGPNYRWSSDHSFVKISANDTGGAYCLIEDNLSAEFSLGLHLHRNHAESFYILEGGVPFYIDGDWMDAAAGSAIHIPTGVEHAVGRVGGPAKMLMIMQPSGFDQFLAELATCAEADLADEAKMKVLAEKYDIVQLGDVPPRPSGGESR